MRWVEGSASLAALKGEVVSAHERIQMAHSVLKTFRLVEEWFKGGVVDELVSDSFKAAKHYMRLRVDTTLTPPRSLRFCSSSRRRSR